MSGQLIAARARESRGLNCDAAGDHSAARSLATPHARPFWVAIATKGRCHGNGKGPDPFYDDVTPMTSRGTCRQERDSLSDGQEDLRAEGCRTEL